MKFIRDIIAEKTRAAEQSDAPQEPRPDVEAAAPEVAPLGGLKEFDAAVRGEDLDPVHQVASGGISLSAGDRIGAGRFDEDDDVPHDDNPAAGGDNSFDFDAFDRIEDGQPGDPPADEPARAVVAEEQAEEEDPFAEPAVDEGDTDLVAEDMAADDGEDESGEAELFADIWSPEGDTAETDAAPEAEAEDDPFRTDIFDLSEGVAPQAAPEAPAPAMDGQPMSPAMPAEVRPDAPQMAEPRPAADPQPVDPQPVAEARNVDVFRDVEDPEPPMPNPASDEAIREMLQRRAPAPAPRAEPEPPRAGIVDSAPATPAAAVGMPGVEVPAPSAGRAARKAGRVKTRLLGFGAIENETDPFAQDRNARPSGQSMYPVGWIVIADGPGRGNAFTLFDGVSQIGRGEDQAVRLDFGDNTISRSNHAAVAYDRETRAFFLGHGGKANLVRLNGAPVLSTEPLHSGAEIRIGETTLRFIALCGEGFDWDGGQNEDRRNAQFG